MNLLNMPTKKYYSSGIVYLKGLACLYVLLAHFYSWHSTICGEQVLGVGSIMRALTRIFQPNGDTNPAVLFFIVVSGYTAHRNGIRENKIISYKNYLTKRIIRLYPMLLVGSVLGGVLWYASNRNVAVITCTSTDDISITGIILKILGIIVLFPQNYLDTYCGNAPLITISVILFCTLSYPFCLKILSGNKRIVPIAIFGIIYVMTFLAVCKKGYNVWWQNASLISFFPYFLLGMYCNGIHNKKHINELILCGGMGEIVMILLCHNSSGVLLNILTEIKKLLLGVSFGMLIVAVDRENVSASKNIVYIIGEYSFSIYCIHAPLTIYLLAVAEIDILSVVIILAACSKIVYQTIETPLYRRLSKG